MSFQTIEQPGTLSTQLGQGFGKGLAETLPKGIERGVLSESLKGLSKPGAAGATPLERFAQLQRIPGMTPELAQQAEQFLRTQAFFGPDQVDKTASITPRGEEIDETVKTPEGKVSESDWIPSQELQERKKSRLQEPSFEDIERKAGELFRSGRANSQEEALNLAEKMVRSPYQKQQNQIAEVKSLLDQKLTSTLQSSGLNQNDKLFGKLSTELRNQAEDLVQRGMTPDAAADKIEKMALDKAKSLSKMKSAARGRNFFRNPQTKANDIKRTRQEFEEIGMEQEFDEMAINAWGISPMRYANKIDPIKSKRLLKDARQATTKSMNRIAEYIKPEDNLWSIMRNIQKYGGNIDKFKDIMSEKAMKRLSPKQLEQLETPISSVPGIGDIFYEVFGGFS